LDILSTSNLFTDSRLAAANYFHEAGSVSKTTSTFQLGYTIPGIFLYLFAGGYIVEDT